MVMNLIHKICFILFITGTAVRSYVWNYHKLGPDVWPHLDKTCGGQSQSPIDIHKKEAYYNPKLLRFNFINYDWPIKFNVTNTGATVIFKQIDKTYYPLKLTGSNLNGTYQFIQFHFHWGENDYQGSEHLIDGNKFPLEMHLIYQARKSIAVLAFLFQLTPKSNPRLEKVLEATRRVAQKGVSTTEVLKLSDILPSPNQLRAYYRYSGSLTVPPCTEGLIWSIFKVPIYISSRQMQSFRINVIKRNFREIQKLDSRDVDSSVCSIY